MAKETKVVDLNATNKDGKKIGHITEMNKVRADLVAIYHNVESALKFVEEYAKYSGEVKAAVMKNEKFHADISYVAKYLKRMEAALSGVSDKFRTSMLKVAVEDESKKDVDRIFSDNDLAFVWSKLNEGSSDPEYKFEGIDETKLFETLLARDEYKDGAAPENAFGMTDDEFTKPQIVEGAEYPSIKEELTLLLNDSAPVDPSFERELKGDSALEINRKSYTVFANGIIARGKDTEGASTGFDMFIKRLDNDVKNFATINEKDATIAYYAGEVLKLKNMIDGLNAEKSGRESAITELNKKIEELKTAMNDKDKNILDLSAKISEKDTEIAKLNAAGGEKDTEIAKLKEERDKKIEELNAAIEEKGNIIKDLNEAVDERSKKISEIMDVLGIEFVVVDGKEVINEKITNTKFEDFVAYYNARIKSSIGFDKDNMLRNNKVYLKKNADGSYSSVVVGGYGSIWKNGTDGKDGRYEDKNGNVAETEYNTIAEAVNARYTPLSESKIIRLIQKHPKSALAIALAGGIALSSLSLGLGLGIPLGQKSAQLEETRNEFNTYREDLKYMTEFFNGLIVENAETSEKAGELTPDELVQLRMIAEKKGEPTSDVSGVSKVSYNFVSNTFTSRTSDYSEERQYFSEEKLQTLYAPVKRIIESGVADEASSLAYAMISIDSINDYTFVDGDPDKSFVDFLKVVYQVSADAKDGNLSDDSFGVLKGYESIVLENNYENFGLTKETDQNGNTVYKDKDGNTVTTIADAFKGYSDIVKEYAVLEQDIKDNYLSKDFVNDKYYSKDYVDQNYTANDVYNAMKEEKDKLVEYITELQKLQNKYLEILQNGNLSNEDRAVYEALLENAKNLEKEVVQKYKDDFANGLDLAGNYEKFDALYQSLLNDYNTLLNSQDDPDFAQKYASYKALADEVDTLIKKFSEALSDKTLTSEEKKDIENDIAKLKQLQGAVNKYGSNYGIAENVENALNSVEGIISEAETNAKTLQGEIDKLEGQISTLTSEKQTLENQKNALQTEYDNFKKNHNHTDAEYKALGDRVSSLTADLAAKEVELQNKIEEYNNLVEQYNTLLSQKEAAEKALADYKKNHNHTDSEYNSLQSQVNSLNSKVSSMSQQLDEQSKKLDEYAKKVVELENKVADITAENFANRAFMEAVYENLTGNECGGMTDEQLRAALAQLMEFDFEFNPNQNGNGDENTNRPTAPEHGG